MIELNRFYKTTLFIFAFFMGATAHAQTLTPFKAEYTAYRWGDALGNASMELQLLAGNQYSLLYQSKVSKFFLSDKRTEHSIFSVENDELVPKEYHYSRSGTGSDKSLHVMFNAQENTITTNAEGKKTVLPWVDETDNQLYRLAMPIKLAQNKKQFEVNFINYRGEKKRYNIQVEKTEVLSLPYGELSAVKVKILRQNSSRQTFAWFAPSLDYMLVRLQQFKDDEEQGDIKLASFVQN